MPRAQKKEVIEKKQEVTPPVTPSVPINPSVKPQDPSFMDQILHSIHDMNMNPYLLGIAYITLNLGSRFFVMSVSPAQEAFLQNTLFRPLLVFAIMFIGTRNLIVAFWMSALILFSLYFLLNENSSWFILRDWTSTHST